MAVIKINRSTARIADVPVPNVSALVLDPNLALNTSAASGYWNTNSNPSSTHEYLADTLGWFYFLNTSAGDWGPTKFDPSTYVGNSFSGVYLGKDLDIVDGISIEPDFGKIGLADCEIVLGIVLSFLI